ncbi:MAG: hypothetical protein ABI691_11050 [Ginsengibacter sp.]
MTIGLPTFKRLGNPCSQWNNFYLTRMPIPSKYLVDFEEEEIFHVYNRTNNNEKLFLNDENRYFFLRRYKEILSPFMETYCWSLLTNHFHLLIRVKKESSIISFLRSKANKEITITEKKFLDKKVSLSELIEQEFKRFFQSYALAYNKMHNRKGNLFYKPFKRIRIEKDSQFTMTMVYIHANPMKHGMVKDFTVYTWSSWQSIISSQPTLL